MPLAQRAVARARHVAQDAIKAKGRTAGRLAPTAQQRVGPVARVERRDDTMGRRDIHRGQPVR